MKSIPDWFPGAGFKIEAKRMREDLERLYNVPFDFVKSQMVGVSTPVRTGTDTPAHQASGSFIPSFTSRYISENEAPSVEQRELVKAAAASLYSGEL